MAVKRNEGLLSVAMFCLAGAILLKRLNVDIPYVAFVEGLLLGVSVALNIAYLVKRPKGGSGENGAATN